MHGTVASRCLGDPKSGKPRGIMIPDKECWQQLDLLLQPLRWNKSPRHIVASSTLKKVPVTRVSYNCVHSPFHSIFHSTVPFHIPVQRLETPQNDGTSDLSKKPLGSTILQVSSKHKQSGCRLSSPPHRHSEMHNVLKAHIYVQFSWEQD